MTTAVASDTTSAARVSPDILTFSPSTGAVPRVTDQRHQYLQVAATVVDDDNPAVVGFAWRQNRASEAASNKDREIRILIPVTNFSDDPKFKLDVFYTVTGTATIDKDFTMSGTTVNITRGIINGVKTTLQVSGRVTAKYHSRSSNTTFLGVAEMFVNILDDDIYEDDETIVLTLIAGDGYRLGDPTRLTNTTTIRSDDDNITISKSSVSVAEAGGTDTYTVVLDSKPSHNVSIAVASDTISAATVTPATLTFTPTNWNSAQTVTVTGVDDNVDQKRNRSATISHRSSSRDTQYNNTRYDNVTATVVDDDGAGVSLSKSSVSVAEAGGTDTYTVVLDEAPSHNVTVAVVSDTTSAARVSPESLTFTPTNWSSSQTVTVTGVDDDVDQRGNRSVSISHTASSTDDKYEGISIASVMARVLDDENAGVSLSKSSVSVAEAGGTDTYTVVLDLAPKAEVSIAVTSDTTSAARVSPGTLTFTPTNWSSSQTVTVTGVNDAVNQNGNRSASISHTASSTNSQYNNININDVTATVVDDDNITISKSSVSVSEAGGTDTYTVVLDSEPSHNVTVAVTSDTTSAATVAPQILTFTPLNWDTAQPVTVTGVNDDVDQSGNRSATITHTASSTDTQYNNISINDVTATVVDDENPGVSLSESTVSVTEDGGIPVVQFAADAYPAGEASGSRIVIMELRASPAFSSSTPISCDVSGTATAGEDFTALRGRVFMTNASGSIAVTITDDEIGEDPETIVITLTGGSGYRVGERDSATITISDDDGDGAILAEAKSGWQLRFGRTVSQQVVDALQQRWSTNPAPGHLTVAGETISSTTPPPPLAENERLLSKALGFDPLTLQDVVEDSSFTIAPQAEEGAPQLAVWGQGALSSFTGEGNGLSSLRGDVTTLLLGADWRTTRWQAGAALSHSWGNGSYEADGGTDGDMSSTLTGLFPYGRYGLTPRLAIWAVAGYGWGQLSLQPDGTDGEYKPTTTTMTMAALGMDGLLLDGGKEGVSLTSTADLLTLKTTSTEVEGLDSSEGSVSRLRLGLEATRAFPLANGASLLPTMAVGIRQDSGNAETGFGMDVGAGMVWRDPERGIRGEVKGRTLLTHREESFQEQGMAISFSWDPTPSNRGPSLSLSHTMGANASGGMDALLNPTTMEDASPSSGGQQEFAAEVAYGFPAHRNRLTLTPAVALALSSTSRNYSLLWSLAPYAGQSPQTPPWEVALEGERQEQHSPTSAVHYSLKLTFSSLF